MRNIDLSLKQINAKERTLYKLSEIINTNKISIVLGAPGSGKSSLFKKYFEENQSTTKNLKVKEFIRLTVSINENIKVLLLDGLDEYRVVSRDKTFVLSELGHKLNELLESHKDLKVVISCREMDWYGESDKNALKNQINFEAVLFNILPLNKDQQKELSELLQIENQEEFLDKFYEKGFLDNPQMFWMLSEIWKTNRDNISSKINLYKQFILKTREINLEHQQVIESIEADQLLKVVGYMAFYYIFSAIDDYNEEVIDQIVKAENGFSKELILNVLKTRVFNEQQFIHRTIAEFALANYIFNNKLDTDIDKARIKSLFIKNNRIPTELRGTYAWLCSISGDLDLINVDPYYQAIHGDNSLFNYDTKAKILLAVREYSKSNPYFFEFAQKMEIEGFYVKELDDLLIKEYVYAFELKNHYVYFLNNIIVQSENPSDEIVAFVRKILEDNDIPTYYKRDFIQFFKSEISYLKELIEKIRNGILLDAKDLLKESILKFLYPTHINHKDIVQYLILYLSDVGGYCYYLFNTQYENKFELVNAIYNVSYDENREPKLLLPKNVKSFIKDYLLETLLEYEVSLSAKDIYLLIKHFKQYYTLYYQLKFESYMYKTTDKVKVSEEKLQRLSNELYEIYVDEMLTQKFERFRVYDFYYFFNYKEPNNKSEVLLKKINKQNDREVNLDLLISGLNYLPRDKNDKPKVDSSIEKLIEEYDFKEEYYNWLYPKKQEWEIKSKKREKKRLEKIEETKRKNEEYFASKSNEEIQKTFADLNWIANLHYLEESEKGEEYLEIETFERLKLILKKSVSEELIDAELLSLSSLAKNSPHAHRNIDTVYYVSLCLNDDNIVIGNIEFEKYLYINVLHHSTISNVIKTNFNKVLEKNKSVFVSGLLKEYLELLIDTEIPQIKELVLKFVNDDSSLENLKMLAKSYNSSLQGTKNSIIENFLSLYGFDLNIDEITSIESMELNSDNCSSIEALKTFVLDKKEEFTVNMAISFHELIKDNTQKLYDRFQNRFLSDLKVKIISYMLFAFNSEESIEIVNGFQSAKNICASFLTDYAFKILLKEDELKILSTLHQDTSDIWKYRILNVLNEQERQEIDKLHGSYSVIEIKEFVLNNSILSQENFFTEICFKIEKLKQEIEDNRRSDKLTFYNENGKDKTPKIEERCRDIILQRLEASYREFYDFTKELYEGENRVDMNIRYIKDLSFEVQIECKRDDNQNLYEGIKNQLIEKYFSSGVKYGLYIIFYFGFKKNKQLMLDKVKKSLPSTFKEKIKIYCLDLTLE
jgi:hypothetical protein